MKKIVLISVVIGVVLLVGVVVFWYWGGVKNSSEGQQAHTEQASQAAHKAGVRESVWEQLSAKQKEEIVGTWKNAQAEKMIFGGGTVHGNKTNTVDDAYTGKEVYFVEFPSKVEPLLGNVIVYADVDTFKIIGYGLRD